MLKLKVKYHDPYMPRLKKLEVGDWVDLCVVDILNFSSVRQRGDLNGWEIWEGDIIIISLGVSIEMPAGYEALIAPRSSLFKKHGLILPNSPAIVDNSYCGDNDIWKVYLYCLKGYSILKKYERILQFRILRNMENTYIEEVEVLGNKNRGGFGSTGE